MNSSHLPQLQQHRTGLTLASQCLNQPDEPSLAHHCPDLSTAIALFKARMAGLDAHLLLHPGDAMAATGPVAQVLGELVRLANTVIGDNCTLPPALRRPLGRQLQRELLPYLLLTATAERFYSKPRGYAGDAETIERIYAQAAGGHGRLGPLVDRAFLEQPAAQAVRNRRHLLARTISDVIAARGSEPARITSLACGPAQEVFDLLQQPSTAQRPEVNLVDVDEAALAGVRARCALLGLTDLVGTHRANLLLLAARRRQLPIAPQHLVYSIGLIDYFDDARVVSLINWAHDHLAPGGALMLGNFHPRNTDKAFMDHVLEWQLIHRDEADMHRLFSLSRFGRSADRIEFESQGINLFATALRR